MILLVDDEPELREEVALFLEKHRGLRVVHASNGREALDQIRTAIDIVVSDVNMPELDGLSLLGELKARSPDIPVILLTGQDDRPTIQKALRLGAFDFVTKPIDLGELSTAVDRALEERRRQRLLRTTQEATEEQHRAALAELQALNTELHRARATQDEFLPQEFPAGSGFRGRVLFLPQGEVGGDIYDFVQPRQQSLGVFIGDVSGHGVSSALIVGMVKLAFSMAADYSEPDGVVRLMNEILGAKLGGHLVTGCYTFCDFAHMEIVHANAGHTPLLFWSGRAARLEELRPSGSLFGLGDAVPEYGIVRRRLASGDRLFWFTDGILEEPDPEDSLFGLGSLKASLEAACRANGDPAAAVLEALRKHNRGSERFRDDVTFLQLEVR